MKTTNIYESFKKIDELCSPRIISSIENCYVKLVKMQGTDLPLHIHTDEDELFIMHKGSMILEVEDQKIELKEGDLFLVEKGKIHRPIAIDVCEVIIIEKKTTAHTGGYEGKMTKTIEEQLRPL